MQRNARREKASEPPSPFPPPQVLVLKQGRVIYQGPTSAVVGYFASLGYVCPPNKDPADFLVSVGGARAMAVVLRRAAFAV
jgi:hypothetical protein